MKWKAERAKWLWIIFCVVSMVSIARGKKEVIIGASPNPVAKITSVGGKGMAELRDSFQILTREFEKFYGYALTLKIYQAPKFLFKALKSGEADFAVLDPPLYLYARNHGIQVKPILMFTPKEKLCIYVRKDSGIKSVRELKGKRFVSDFPIYFSKRDPLPPKESYIYWIKLKKFLQQKGIHAPFMKFFKEFKVLPVPLESVAYAVVLKKFDAFAGGQYYVHTLKTSNRAFKELKALSCRLETSHTPLVYRRGVSPDLIKNVRKYFTDKNSQFAISAKEKYKGVKPLPATERDYALYFQWLKEAEKKGWIKEFNQIMKKVPKPVR